MDRLTVNDLNKVCYDPWELCGMDSYCTKGCHEEGGCAKGCHILKMYRKLAEYETLEEQGKLLKLPCAVGDTVYHLCTFENGESEIIEMKVGCVEPCGALRNHKRVCEIWNVYAEADYTKGYFKFSDFGETVFLTQEEAEATLKEMSE